MKKVLLILCFLVLFGAGYSVFSFYTAKRIVTPSKTLYGNIDVRDLGLSFRVAGKVSSVFFEEGDRVRQGDVVAQLDTVPFEEALALYQAELAEIAIVLKNAEQLYQRKAKLVTSGAISSREFDDVLAARDEAQARYATCTAKIMQAKTKLTDATLISPSDGVIVTRIREPGSIVAEGMPLYTLVLDTPVWVRAYIDESRLGMVHPGKKVRIITDSGGVYEGQVGFVSSQAEFTPKNVETTELRTQLVYRLRLIITAPDNHLRQGMPVTVYLE